VQRSVMMMMMIMMMMVMMMMVVVMIVMIVEVIVHEVQRMNRYHCILSGSILMLEVELVCHLR